MKAVAKRPSLDTNEEVHTVVRVHTAHVYCAWVCANGASCGNCCCAILYVRIYNCNEVTQHKWVNTG